MAKGKSFLKALLAMGIAACALAVAAAITAAALDAPTGKLGDEGAMFIVAKGESIQGISNRLEREGVVRSAFFLQIMSRLGVAGREVRAGAYRIEPTMGSLDVLRLLESGTQSSIRVTFPEGIAMGAVARLLESASVSKAAGFLAACKDPELLKELGIDAPSAEGYLFPDTYYFIMDQDPKEIVRLMVGTFSKRLAEYVPGSAGMSAKDIRDKLTLASIVEREYRVEDEAPLIASVFANRLKKGIGLESCATIVYIITEIQGKKHPKKIFYQDLAIDSPYNTYKWAGLPPGPISNPGRVALQAAFSPARTDYYYFRLVDPAEGRHKFSKTLAEHDSAPSFWVKD